MKVKQKSRASVWSSDAGSVAKLWKLFPVTGEFSNACELCDQM